MGATDRRVDAYIAKAPSFARPILRHLRLVVHEACPAVEETIRWGMPHFDHHGMLCMMAAFKAHCTFGFRQGERVLGARSRDAEAMGDFGRITALADLPSKARIKALVRTAMKLNEQGSGAGARRSRTKRPPVRVPRDLAAALESHPAAASHFAAFPPGQRREYIEWITEAKTEVTRTRRLASTIDWLAKGRYRNWKYM